MRFEVLTGISNKIQNMVLCSLVIDVNISEEPALFIFRVEDWLIYPEDGDIMFLRNSVTCLPNYVGHILEDCSLKGM
jgi:hypothetical protein